MTATAAAEGTGRGRTNSIQHHLLLIVSTLALAAWLVTLSHILQQHRNFSVVVLSHQTSQLPGSELPEVTWLPKNAVRFKRLRIASQMQQVPSPEYGSCTKTQQHCNHNLDTQEHNHQQRQPEPMQEDNIGCPIGASNSISALDEQLHRNTGPVDVVYLWVNGSDPRLQRSLQAHLHLWQGDSRGTQQQAYDDPAGRQSRFDAGRDELRYSLRSLDMYLPWYRHLYIVTNGQVPSWLDVLHPRVTIVPHSSIFLNASHLPTFNSLAIQANVANIPGLSESFILFDDDWFLTAAWTMHDFVGSDGGQLTTGTALAAEVKPDNMYLNVVFNLDRTFKERLGDWPRTDPSHAPHYMQLHWIRQLHACLPDLFRDTSAARFRTPTDLLLAAAYQWFMSRYQPGQHGTTLDEVSVFAVLSDITAKLLSMSALVDLTAQQRAGDASAQALMNSKEFALGGFTAQANLAASATAALVASGHDLGPQTSDRAAWLGAVLQGTWARELAKMVCLQDDLSDESRYARPLIDAVVKRFLQSRYPVPSQYELPTGLSNGCSNGLAPVPFGRVPTAADFEAACRP